MLGSFRIIRNKVVLVDRPFRSPTQSIRSGFARRKLATKAAGSSFETGFPSWKERNVRLNKDLKLLLKGDRAAISQLKESAAALRRGEASASAFLSEFRELCGNSSEADSILEAVKQLLPTADLQATLELATTSSKPPVLLEVAAQPREASGSKRPPSEAALTASSATSAADDRQQQVIAGPAATPTREGNSRGGGVAAGAADREPCFGDNNGDSSPLREQRPAKRQRERRSAAAVGGSGGAVVWLRQDLRIHDNPTLVAAAMHARRHKALLTFLYVHSPSEDGDKAPSGSSWRPGAASCLWLHYALANLNIDLQRQFGPGAGIIFRKGPYAEAVAAVAEAAEASDVFLTERHEPQHQAADERVVATLEQANLSVHTRQAFLLHPPQDIHVDMSKWTGHFGTLTPFDRACSRLKKPGKPLPPPSSKDVPTAGQRAFADVCSRAGACQLTDLGLAAMPVAADGHIVDWGAGVIAAWRTSEADALSILEEFLQAGFQSYEVSRQFADARAVSRLSPYLHFGQLSPRRVLYDAMRQGGATVSKTFMRRLVWRDLAYWQLHHWPSMPREPIRPQFALQEWREDKEMLRAWQKGTTGFPLVDAGMRQLYQTGWMQQSLRMVVACFLTEYLNMPWVEGAAWFHDTLVDADMAINSMMWQNAGKSGMDQWNFTLLPTSRAQDPKGDFTRMWVPELAKLPTKHLAAPWEAPPHVLDAAGVCLGTTYPHRIIQIDMQALKAANHHAIQAARQAHPQPSDSNGYDLIRVPQGSTKGHDGQMMRVYTIKPLRAVTK